MVKVYYLLSSSSEIFWNIQAQIMYYLWGAHHCRAKRNRKNSNTMPYMYLMLLSGFLQYPGSGA